MTREELRELTLAMVARDSALRLSPEVQAKYARVSDFGADKDAITEGVQRRVAREFGFRDGGISSKSRGKVDEGVEVMRAALFLFPGDQEIIQAAHYFKFNIHRPCEMAIGDVVPLDLPLYHLARRGLGDQALAQIEEEGNWPRLRDVVVHEGLQPTVLIVGSHT